MVRSAVLLLVSFFIAACSSGETREVASDRQSQERTSSDVGKRPAEKSPAEKPRISNDCSETQVAGKRVLETQTFEIDFEPFEGACFVTAHDPDQADPPIGSVFAIYKDGKRIYKFDTRYHEDAATCWVEAVAFRDLDEDGKKDVIIVGQCGAKSGPIQGNEVHLNTGDGFRTKTAWNDSLEDQESVSEIEEYFRNNRRVFE